jgi:hypothetical protein
MDPISAGLNLAGGLIGKGGLFDQLYYSPEEQAQDSANQALAGAQLESVKFGRESLIAKGQAQQVQIAANQKLALYGLAGVALLAGAYVVSRSA